MVFGQTKWVGRNPSVLVLGYEIEGFKGLIKKL